MSQSKHMLLVLGLAFSSTYNTTAKCEIVRESMQNSIVCDNTKDKEENVINFISVHQEDTKGEVVENTKEDAVEKDYIGEFTITHYCSCKICCGKWYGSPAANGEPLKEGYTIAVDTNVIPLNSKVIIDGYGIRKAQDTGSAIKGNRIDVYINNHEKCIKMGVIKKVKVWIVRSE